MKISILTPSYNSGKYLKRAIDSVINQDYKNYEHIIADGNSTDDTKDIVKDYPYINFISEPDHGQSDAMNKAFERSTGDIIVYLNADDEFLPNAFSCIIKAFIANPDADMVVGDLLFKTDTETLRRVPSNQYKKILLYWLNLFPNNPVSYFYKRRVQETIGKFPVDEHYAMDMWFLLKAYRKFKVTKVDEVLGIFHSDGANKTATIDAGYHLHKTAKAHLKNDNPIIAPYFYFKLFLARFFKKN